MKTKTIILTVLIISALYVKGQEFLIFNACPKCSLENKSQNVEVYSSLNDSLTLKDVFEEKQFYLTDIRRMGLKEKVHLRYTHFKRNIVKDIIYDVKSGKTMTITPEEINSFSRVKTNDFEYFDGKKSGLVYCYYSREYNNVKYRIAYFENETVTYSDFDKSNVIYAYKTSSDWATDYSFGDMSVYIYPNEGFIKYPITTDTTNRPISEFIFNNKVKHKQLASFSFSNLELKLIEVVSDDTNSVFLNYNGKMRFWIYTKEISNFMGNESYIIRTIIYKEHDVLDYSHDFYENIKRKDLDILIGVKVIPEIEVFDVKKLKLKRIKLISSIDNNTSYDFKIIGIENNLLFYVINEKLFSLNLKNEDIKMVSQNIPLNSYLLIKL